MTDEVKHTSTPWQLMIKAGRTIVSTECESGCRIVAEASGPQSGPEKEIAQQQADAAFIVEAVNAHDTLKLQVEKLRAALQYGLLSHDPCNGEFWCPCASCMATRVLEATK